MMLKKFKGVSLLEAMLVLVIISILVIVSVRYFGTTSAAKKRTSAIAQMNAIFNASKQYIDSEQSPEVELIKDDGTSVLVDGNYLTQAETKNPWLGSISVCWGANSSCSGNDSKTLKITMSGLSEMDCSAVLQSLSNTTVGSMNKCQESGKAQELTVYYQLF